MVGVKRGVGVTVVGARQPRRGVNSGIKHGLVQTAVVGVKHGFRATSDAQQQHVQIRAVAVEAPRKRCRCAANQMTRIGVIIGVIHFGTKRLGGVLY